MTASSSIRSAIVIGGGLEGAASAYALAKHGFSVTLVEAQSELAAGASHANAGMITPSMSDPWNYPGAVSDVALGMLNGQSPLHFRLPALAREARWLLAFLRSARHAHFDDALCANYRLAAFSRAKLLEIKRDMGLDFAHHSSGSIKVFRSHKALEAGRALANKLADHGLIFEELTAREAAQKEPVLLGSQDSLAGALYFPEDDVGDARQFVHALSDHLHRIGVKIRLSSPVSRINLERSRVTGVSLGAEHLSADVVVVAAGIGSRSLLKPSGISLQIAPVKGYSLTFALPNVQLPRQPIVDTSLHTVVSRIGDRLRVAGIAEIAGEDATIEAKRIHALMQALKAVYPNEAERFSANAAQSWAGLRPATADGLPYIGPTAIKGLFVNTGHGHLGWTMAAGSADLLSAKILGHELPLDPTPYRASRHS